MLLWSVDLDENILKLKKKNSTRPTSKVATGRSILALDSRLGLDLSYHQSQRKDTGNWKKNRHLLESGLVLVDLKSSSLPVQIHLNTTTEEVLGRFFGKVEKPVSPHSK